MKGKYQMSTTYLNKVKSRKKIANYLIDLFNNKPNEFMIALSSTQHLILFYLAFVKTPIKPKELYWVTENYGTLFANTSLLKECGFVSKQKMGRETLIHIDNKFKEKYLQILIETPE